MLSRPDVAEALGPGLRAPPQSLGAPGQGGTVLLAPEATSLRAGREEAEGFLTELSPLLSLSLTGCYLVTGTRETQPCPQLDSE